MIAEHQPKLFGLSVKVIFSSVDDGSMATGGGKPSRSEHLNNRHILLTKHTFSSAESIVLSVRYSNDKDYKTIRRVFQSDLGSMVDCDGFYTTDTAVPLLLPVADCIATVVYDPTVHLLGVIHLGRHASLAGAIESFAAEVQHSLGSKPINWQVWMSPNLQQSSNMLDYFNPDKPEEWQDFIHTDTNKIAVDIPMHNKHRFELLGVLPQNIEISSIDTYTDERYYSHRAAVEQSQPERDGRMVVIAEITD